MNASAKRFSVGVENCTSSEQLVMLPLNLKAWLLLFHNVMHVSEAEKRRSCNKLTYTGNVNVV